MGEELKPRTSLLQLLGLVIHAPPIPYKMPCALGVRGQVWRLYTAMDIVKAAAQCFFLITNTNNNGLAHPLLGHTKS
jgi:hypothetical protein